MYIQPFYDCDTTREEYAQYLKGQHDWAKNVLAQPVKIYPNGKTSHECANLVLEQYFDLALEFSEYCPVKNTWTIPIL